MGVFVLLIRAFIKYFLSIIVLYSMGCASKGFNRGELINQIGTVKPVFDDEKIKQAYKKKPNLSKPFKLGIYFTSPKNTYRFSGPDWRWTEQDKTVFDELSKELITQGLISEAFPILDSLVQTESFDNVRLAAAQHQADAILIINGVGDIDRYINSWGWTYAFLLPAFLIPGSEADILFISSAALWDVKNQYLYLTAEAEASSNNTYIAAFGKQDRELINTVKYQALTNLKLEVLKMIKGTKF